MATQTFAQYNLTISKSDNRFVITQTGLNATDVTRIATNTVLAITCDSSVTDAACGLMTASLGQNGIPLTQNARTWTGTVVAGDVSGTNATRLRVLHDNQDIGTGFQLMNATATTTTAPGGVRQLRWTAHPCDSVRITNAYEEVANRAHFVVTPGGSFLQQPNGPVDEDDAIAFHVVSTDQALLQQLEVVRTSPTRTTGTLSIQGEGTSVQRQALGPAQPCYQRTFELGDFAPGEAVVELYTIDQRQRTVVGTAKFNVNRLWHGIMSFGPMRSSIDTQAFGLLRRDDKNIIVRTENAAHDLVYVVQYTQYWRRRDSEKRYPFYQHINPSIGIALEDSLDQAFVGASIDWRQFVFTIGAHVRDVTVLARDAGLRAGGEFGGTAEQLPLETERQTGLYVGVSVDARAIRTLFDAIATPQ